VLSICCRQHISTTIPRKQALLIRQPPPSLWHRFLAFLQYFTSNKSENYADTGQQRRKLKLMLMVMTLCCVTALYMQRTERRIRWPYIYRLPLPYRHQLRPFSVHRRHPKWVRYFMRFSLEEFLTFVPLLRLNSVVYPGWVKASPELALAVVCYRMVYSKRLLDCCEVFG
jgi:hypothetical protein